MERCEWKEQSTRLKNPISWMSAAISIENGKKALVCFPSDDERKCEVFDSATSNSTFATRYRHWGGRLGFYRGKPTTVGSDYDESGDGTNKVEFLSSSGWRTLNDFPKKYLKKTFIYEIFF